MTIVEKVILFNDIKGSSNLWKKYGKNMYNAIQKLIKLMNKDIKDYNNAYIVKILGDSFMIVFDDIEHAVKFSMKINNDLLQKKTGIFLDKSKKKPIHLRTGIAYGKVNIYKTKIQGCVLDDYFGNVVNIASRMESVLSSVNGLRIAFIKKDKDIKYIVKLLETYENYKVTVFDYSIKCKNDRNKRSAKLLTDLSINCGDLYKLHGVDEVKVISVDHIKNKM